MFLLGKVVFDGFSADFYMLLILTFTHWLDLNELVLIKCFSTVEPKFF